jgi:hypothetical protein
MYINTHTLQTMYTHTCMCIHIPNKNVQLRIFWLYKNRI